jgi:hypothetical protein
LEAHVNHLITEAVGRMHGITGIGQQDKALNEFASRIG